MSGTTAAMHACGGEPYADEAHRRIPFHSVRALASSASSRIGSPEMTDAEEAEESEEAEVRS
jgi:hypothetical protein